MLQFHGAKKPSDSYLECAHYLEETFEKWTASEQATYYHGLMVMEQFLYVAKKEFVPLLG